MSAAAPMPPHLGRRPREVTVAATQFACGWDAAATRHPAGGVSRNISLNF